MLTSFFSFSGFQPLPEVPRIWKPAVQCPDCSYPNDTGFRFCQACGYKRKSLAPDDNPHLVSLDLPSLDHRLEALQAVHDHKPYQVQKSKLRKELESFLSSLPCPKTLLSASPRDVTRFLVWKDKKGKTKIHVSTCSLFGAKKAEVCSCPSTLAAGTVANLIGKLRSLFVESGRGGEWNDLLGIGNPASHHSVKQYLILIREEQARARITPKQAVPLFFDKLLRLCSFLKESIFAPQILPLQRYIYARDLAFFCLQFFAGDRASDLGRIFTKEVLTLPDDEGFLFKHTFGKTLRGKNSNTFMVKKCSNTTVCPVFNLRLYVQLCDLMTVNLRDGHLFRTTNKSTVSTSPFIGSAVANRLIQHLKTLGIHNGESMHSFRSGCSITLSLLGVTSEEVARHVGWRSLDTAEYYTQTKKVMNMSNTASVLASSTAVTPSGAVGPASSVAQVFRAKNALRDFSLTFP